jgi:hypothetical protein
LKYKLQKFKPGDPRSIHHFLSLAGQDMEAKGITETNEIIMYFRTYIRHPTLMAKLTSLYDEFVISGKPLTLAMINAGLVQTYTYQSAHRNPYNLFIMMTFQAIETPLDYFLRLVEAMDRVGKDYQAGLVTKDKLIDFSVLSTKYMNDIEPNFPKLSKEIFKMESKANFILTKQSLETLISDHLLLAERFQKRSQKHFNANTAQLDEVNHKLMAIEDFMAAGFHQINRPKREPRKETFEEEEIKESWKQGRRQLTQEYDEDDNAEDNTKNRKPIMTAMESALKDLTCYACNQKFNSATEIISHFRTCDKRRENQPAATPEYRKKQLAQVTNRQPTNSDHVMTQQQKESVQFPNKGPNKLPMMCRDVKTNTESTLTTRIGTNVKTVTCRACHKIFSVSAYWAEHVQRCPASFCILCGLWGHSKFGCQLVRCKHCKRSRHINQACQFFENPK